MSLLLCFHLGIVSQGQEEEEEYDYKILFVGNSFTNYHGINKLTGAIAESLGIPVQAQRLSSDGYYLHQFASRDDDYGRFLHDRLDRVHDYNVLVLQEQSMQPILDYTDFLESVRILRDRILETQDTVDIYLYETWAYLSAAELMRFSVPEMQMKLKEAYEDAAQELGLKMVPVGEAFQLVREEHPNIGLFAQDQKHPSYAGSYLAACVMASVIFNIDVRESDFDGLLDKKTAAALREAAYDCVYDKLFF